jgi:hypothetical protein
VCNIKYQCEKHYGVLCSSSPCTCPCMGLCLGISSSVHKDSKYIPCHVPDVATYTIITHKKESQGSADYTSYHVYLSSPLQIILEGSNSHREGEEYNLGSCKRIKKSLEKTIAQHSLQEKSKSTKCIDLPCENMVNFLTLVNGIYSILPL